MTTDAFLRLYFALPEVAADVFRMVGAEEGETRVKRLDLSSVAYSDDCER